MAGWLGRPHGPPIRLRPRGPVTGRSRQPPYRYRDGIDTGLLQPLLTCATGSLPFQGAARNLSNVPQAPPFKLIGWGQKAPAALEHGGGEDTDVAVQVEPARPVPVAFAWVRARE